MREIKFRAFDPVAQEMKYSPRMHRKPDGTIWASIDEESGFLTIVPLMQFTGLLDRNGTEIYEGDVLKVVGAESGEMLVHVDDITMMPLSTLYGAGEVIGNVHQNPELLK